ncbi:MAG: glycerophosphodiester phosphodiesterase [Deltaproteobacteria bacterium]|nr:MAG: glycerophosphodiester phosphodiesterase [Deltaproteobacteria bacterium]
MAFARPPRPGYTRAIPLPRPKRPLLYSHRGASRERPENTLPSFLRALEIGTDAIETDAHMTADGHVVLSHDPDGWRMCAVRKRIRDWPLAEVQSWDAGFGFVDADGHRPFAGRGYRIPTLAEVLDALPDTPLNIDLKQTDPPIAPAVVRLLRERDAERRVTLASFHREPLDLVRRLGYRGPTALSEDDIRWLLLAPRCVWRALRRPGDAAQVPPLHGRIRFARRRFIRKCHQLGLRVDYWTINDPGEAARLLDAGADGIMTDDPAAIAPVFRSRYPDFPSSAPPRPAGA